MANLRWAGGASVATALCGEMRTPSSPCACCDGMFTWTCLAPRLSVAAPFLPASLLPCSFLFCLRLASERRWVGGDFPWCRYYASTPGRWHFCRAYLAIFSCAGLHACLLIFLDALSTLLTCLYGLSLAGDGIATPRFICDKFRGLSYRHIAPRFAPAGFCRTRAYAYPRLHCGPACQTFAAATGSVRTASAGERGMPCRCAWFRAVGRAGGRIPGRAWHQASWADIRRSLLAALARVRRVGSALCCLSPAPCASTLPLSRLQDPHFATLRLLVPSITFTLPSGHSWLPRGCGCY